VGLGSYFQFIDSEIANRVMMKMIDEGRPVLPMHDSFICRKSDGHRLNFIMKQSFRDQMLAMHLTPITVRTDLV